MYREKRPTLYHAAPKYLAKMIRQAAARTGFVGIIIYGLQGAGKSTLALWTAYYTYGNWDAALRAIFFDLGELIDLIESGQRYPLIIADDAGVHMNKYLYRTNVKKAEFITNIIQVARTHFNSILFTTPHPNMLSKSIRDQPDWIYVAVRPLSKRKFPPVSAVLIYHSLPSPRRVYVKRVQRDEIPFTVWLPDEIYKKYMKIRRSYAQRILEEFIQQYNTGREK